MSQAVRNVLLAAWCLLTLPACTANRPTYPGMQNALVNPSGDGGNDGGGGSGGGGM